MTDHEKLIKLCNSRLQYMCKAEDIMSVNCGEANEIYEPILFATEQENNKRLELELQEIKKKEESWLFLRFYKAVKHKTLQPLDKNEHNLFTWYILGVCQDFNFNKGPSFTEAEMPDIDVDYHPVIREYLKDDFSFRQYGKQHVSNIGSYQTYGVRSSLIDMARVMNFDRDEIISITKKMGMKDDEGEDVTFDNLEDIFIKIEQKDKEKKQLTKYEQTAKELFVYKKNHEKVWESAKNLVVSQIDWKKFDYKKPPHRKKSMGQHASGLIISGANLPEFVPLIVPPGSREQGLQATAWVEGLADTDCSSVGLIKFDYLSLEANAKVAECNRLIMERHGLESICALPGLSNWSNTSYLDDPKALEMANAGDLKGIFQFDSNGIRRLAKKGGVTSFNDLVAYSSLYRPGPMDEGMHDEYCDRKNGKKDFEIHPLLSPFLSTTYGVLCFQEQVMRTLNVVGNIPLKDCEAVRKAISKKKIDKFEKYKEMFIENGKINLSQSTDYLVNLWAQIEAFAGYGFNLSVDKDTEILTPMGVKKIEDFISGDVVYSVDENGNTVETEVIALHDHGVLEGYEVTFDDGYVITCTLDHKFLTPEGQKPLREIVGNNSVVLCDPNIKQWRENAEEKVRGMDSPMWNQAYKSYGTKSSQQVVCDMSGEIVYNGQVESQMWNGVENKNACEQTSTKLPRMSQTCLETRRNQWRDSYCSKQSQMWSSFGYLAFNAIASKELFRMLEDKRTEYPNQKLQSESIQGSPDCFCESSKNNFCETRNPSGACRTSQVMERKKSRRIRQMHRSSVEKPEAVQNGGMVKEDHWLGDVTHKVWGREKASGFCQKSNLDRSRWILSLQRISTCRQKTNFNCSSRTRCNAQQRSVAKGRYNVNTFEHGVFCFFNRGNERTVVPATFGHAGISNTGHLVSRKIVRVVPVGKRKMYDLEVASRTHNFLLPSGIVTSNSHAVAYTYISARQLWQKAHYALEFYTAALRSLKTADPRISVYIQDARKKSISVNPLDLNKSRFDFEIGLDDEIYYGFNKIKGIGHDVASKIVELQPYAGFEDFLERFGTEAKVIQPLICLKVFNEKDPHTLYLYYETYKKALKAESDRCQRNKNSVNNYIDKLQSLIGQDKKWEHGFDDNYFGKLRSWLDDDQWIELCTLKKKYDKCINTFAQKSKNKEDIGQIISINSFVPPSPSKKGITLNKTAFKTYKSIKQFLKDVDGVDTQQKFYGFPWKNDFEQIPTYKGFTFEDFELDILRAVPGTSLPVEVKIMQTEHAPSRSGKMWYWKIRVVDALEPDVLRTISVWEHDYDRFESLLQVGNIVRMRLLPPEPPYPNYSLQGVKPWEMRGKNPYGDDPKLDLRVFLLAKGSKKMKFIDDEDDSYLMSPGRKKKSVEDDDEN